jgi:hypothetical protein
VVCGGARSSAVKKSGPEAYDEGGWAIAADVVGVPTVSLAGPRSILGREAILVRGVGVGGDLTLGEADRSRPGELELGDPAASDGTEEVRLSQLERNPPLFALGVAVFAASLPSSFFSTIRHPVGTWSSITICFARTEASHANEPFEFRKCANGLFRVIGRFRVSLRHDASSFEAWVCRKCTGAWVGGSVGTSRFMR